METMKEQNLRVDDSEIEIDLKELFFALLEKAWLIIIVGVICGIIAYAYTSMLVTPLYQSTTKVYVLNRTNENALTSSDLSTSTQLTSDYEQLILSRDVLEVVVDNLSLDMTYGELLNSITVSTLSDTRILSIVVTNASPTLAQEIAVEVRTVATEHIQSVMAISAVNIAEEANLPTSPSSPNTMKNVAIAVLLGVFLVCGIVVLMFLLDDKIKNENDIEKYLGIGVLGVLPVFDDEKTGRKKSTSRKTKQNSNARKSSVNTQKRSKTTQAVVQTEKAAIKNTAAVQNKTLDKGEL